MSSGRFSNAWTTSRGARNCEHGYSASCTERHWSGAGLWRWMIAWTPLMRSSSPDSRAKANGARPPADLERLMFSKEIGELIRGCMDGLPVNQREAFVLREVEGLGTGEICKILAVSVTNFWSVDASSSRQAA